MIQQKLNFTSPSRSAASGGAAKKPVKKVFIIDEKNITTDGDGGVSGATEVAEAAAAAAKEERGIPYTKTFVCEEKYIPYYNSMTDVEKLGCNIAFSHLGYSFCIPKSNGYKKWSQS